MRRKEAYLLLWICLCAFFISLQTKSLAESGQLGGLKESAVASHEYREQRLCEEMIEFLRKHKSPGEYVSVYLMESKYGYQAFDFDREKDSFMKLLKKWKSKKAWSDYQSTTESIWNDVKYFPIPKSTSDKTLSVSYVNSWMSKRSYKGERGHEGTDLMAKKNERGLYPILSMTDGVVEKKGWLEKGGYRIGIRSPKGAYFYYAHLDSYAKLNVGDHVKAGDILGFMGDSGYGPEGTKGQFGVHLHLGIYIYPEGKETSVNPYWILRYIENRKVKCYTET